MDQTMFTVVVAIILGITSGAPLHTCDKLKDVREGVDNYDQYLVKLNDSDNYKDAENVINLVDQFQTTLDLYASNVHEPLIKSKLALSDNAGVLHGTLSQQSLFLVCLESSVEFILPDYSNNSQGFGSDEVENVPTANCSKLILKEPYTGNNYSVSFKRKVSMDTLYQIITIMELTKLSDKNLTFNYYYSIRRGNKITMVAKMNIKALNMVCEEQKVKQIKPIASDDTSVISQRNTRAVSEQQFITSTTLNGHCDLPEHNEEVPTFIFVYHEQANLKKIIKSVKEYNSKSAVVQLAVAIENVHMIIFQMNRAAYLWACRNPAVALVEYAQPTTQNLPESTPTSEMPQISEPLPTETADICQHIDSLRDKINTYSVLLSRPQTVENRRKQCSRLIKKLERQANKNSHTFYAVPYPQQSCQPNENDIKLIVKLNTKALKYVCTLKGLQVSVAQS